MLPSFVTLLVNMLLDYLAKNSDKIVAALKKEFESLSGDSEVQSAIQELGYSASEEALNKLHTVIESKGEDPGRIAKVIINETSV